MVVFYKIENIIIYYFITFFFCGAKQPPYIEFFSLVLLQKTHHWGGSFQIKHPLRNASKLKGNKSRTTYWVEHIAFGLGILVSGI